MTMNPAMMETMAHSKMADMQQAAHRRSAVRHPSVVARRTTQPRSSRPVAVRRTIGWFLVSVGLRLAISRRRSVAAL
jgi:hypothetical protein